MINKPKNVILLDGRILIFVFVLINSCFANVKEENAIVEYLSKNNFLVGKAEIVFLLDRSGSVGAANFETEKGFVESFLTHIVVDANASRVAVISYSDTAERHIDFLKTPKTKCHLSEELQEVVFKDSRATNIAAALDEGLAVFQNARPNVNKVLILVSDGLYTKGGHPKPSADRLKASGVQIFCFGIGKSLQNELQILASSKQHVYSCDGFRDFSRLAKKIRGDPHESSWSGQAAKPNCDHLCDSPYRGEPNDPGCCDHEARCSCALLSGMHVCVCGPGYYGHSGLAGHCKPCPLGTYKSKLEPTNQCKSCPSGSTTKKIASRSLKDCVCKKGYQGAPAEGIPCTPLKCPPLQTPSHGLILGNCKDTAQNFGTECHFFCEEGYELITKDSQVRECKDDGAWSGQAAICQPIRCKQPKKPQAGKINCDNKDLLVGSKCRFTCDRGYMMEGSEERQCLSTKRWSGSKVNCIPVQCDLPPPLRYGQIYFCRTDKKPEYMDSCIYKCSDGFELQGPATLYCMENGKLMTINNEERKPSCVDKEPPDLKCPDPVVVPADKGSNGAHVLWREPQPSDNSGIVPKLLTEPKYIYPGDFMKIGRTVVRYVAVDHVGLQSSCEFQVTVYDNEAPTVIRCPPKTEVIANDRMIPVYWDEPVFEDNSGEKVEIIQSHQAGHKFSQGRHTVTYRAVDSNNNEATCSFDVIMTRNTCPFYPAPVNGALICNDWMDGQICRIECNARYDFVEKPADWYLCDVDSTWITEPLNMPIPWPDCSTRVIPNKIKHMMRGFYYQGDCNDPDVQVYLKKKFLQHLSVRFEKAELCFRQGACSLQTVRVVCGKTTDHARRRRDIWEHVGGEDLELEFEITIDVDQELNDTEAVIQNFLETIQNLKWDMDEDFALQPTTSIPFLQSDSQFSHQNESNPGSVVFTEGETILECKPGSVPNNDLCMLCSPGTYYDSSARECRDCPVGHYQEEEGQLGCNKCPNGMTTEYSRSRNETECKGICQPGTYSPTGLETCLACPIGTYQEHAGQHTCSACPEGTTTAGLQSVSEFDCWEICDVGHFSNTGLQPCDACPKGFYQPFTGQSKCLECPGNFSTKVVGSTNATECLDLNPCAEEGHCTNDGICQRHGRIAKCFCKEGFAGDRCERDIDECEQKPCFNNGVCLNVEGSFFCNCSAGFSGALCEAEVDECLSSPCLNNGTCLDKVNDFACLCPAGYEGPQCERAQEICYPDILCLNGGTCLEPEGSNHSYCVCSEGFAGIDCSVDVDDCENITCLNNGRCVDEVASFKCFCKDGFKGLMCETEINECEFHQCFSGSICEDLVGKYQCICPPGWSGTFCETKLNSDFVLNFPDSKATIANMASMKLNSPLSDVTVSMWVQTTDTQRSGTPMSYAVASASTTDGENTVVDNALTINDCSGVRVFVNNEPLVTEVQVADGQWHHLAFTWSSENSGEWTLYKDGKQQSNGTHLRPNEVIPGGGSLVIGQEQDAVGGGFSPVETFTGNITRVNMWNSYFSKSNITRLCSLDDDIPGKVVAWPDFLPGVKGNVNILQNQQPL
ncbi:sushi, von Willebrand factor type A, EGF and pentraxin domain-containing protein 1 [Nephila pilipes]|uniref:Sushi, von Willebrand factor type A, EGF and pentraxin domain-containing protein 1 n=1 Tax=Nephila pilipes TaxID=299642 RepID=A0A8X6PH28_NEPPI|nr:sushi, von Willebrand factor type A, EGF and pentraxin domain-containing protein 1 [Nephila pilipes]